MEGSLFEIAAKEGIWAALFIFLLLYQLNQNKQTRAESRERESILTDFIREMSKNFESLTSQYERLSNDVDYIKVEVAKQISNKE